MNLTFLCRTFIFVFLPIRCTLLISSSYKGKLEHLFTISNSFFCHCQCHEYKDRIAGCIVRCHLILSRGFFIIFSCTAIRLFKLIILLFCSSNFVSNLCTISPFILSSSSVKPAIVASESISFQIYQLLLI